MPAKSAFTPLQDAPLVLVVFGGACALPWLKLLRPGFRHCFLLRRFPEGWLLYDPRSDRTELELWPACDPNLVIKHLKKRGYTALSVTLPTAERRAVPLGPFTCVEAVKRVLGIRRRRVVTPWQLYRHLNGRG